MANLTFFAYISNSLFTVILGYADFRYFPVLSKFFAPGLFPDYSVSWFEVVGEIIVTTETLRSVIYLVMESLGILSFYLF